MTTQEFIEMMSSIGNAIKNLSEVCQVCLNEVTDLQNKILEIELLLVNHKERIEELQREVREEYNPTKQKEYMQ
jgi:hypothetical protein